MKVKSYDGRHDPQIATLIELIQHKAAEHSYKGEWSKLSTDTLFKYMQGEVTELHLAIERGNMFEALREIGDVGFCLVMLAESLMRERTLTPEAIAHVQARVLEDIEQDKIKGSIDATSK